ncbi:MAG: glycosyltransferase [Desulfobulbaceae bacterium]|nr:glycosyltransferase [Desulfobulbaceae bacterium]
MINIMHVSDKLSVGNATIHGVTRLLSWWLPRFAPHLYRVNICSLRYWDAAADYLKDLNIDVRCLNRSKFDPLTLLDLIKIINEQKIDLLHLHGYGAATFGRVAGLLTSTPVIVHEHMSDVNIPYYQELMDAILSRLNYQAIAVSSSVKEFMMNRRHIPKDRIQVIKNGVPFEMFDKLQKGSKPQTYRSQLNIPSHHKMVAIVGRLDPIKGHRNFLNAATLVLDAHQDVSFVIVGDGELMDNLQQQCRELKIESNVIFMGYCNDVPSLLFEADIKAISSISEGIPMTLFEAMAAGCATVSTNVGGLGEVIVEGITGFLVPPENPEAMAEKLLLLLRDDRLLKKMSKHAKEDSVQYDIFNTVHLIEESYNLSLNQNTHIVAQSS